MPDNKKEQIKLYIVIGLALIAAIFAYFRFIHKKAPRGAGPAPSTVSIAPLDLPRVDLKIPQTAQKSESLIDRSLRPVIRDIFEPLKWPEKAESKPPEPEPPKPKPVLKLRGTIVGGESALAIINGQFVRTGDLIGKYRVVRIDKDEVLLSSNGDQMVLEIYKNE